MTSVFAPPKDPVLVTCLHCNTTYDSSEIVLESRFNHGLELWWCKDPECDGAGFGFDIFEADSPMVTGDLK